MFSEFLKSSIAGFLAEHYGIEGTLERLGGENLNVLVVTGQGERFVLKIATGGSADDVARMEDQLFRHIAQAGFSLELPTIIKTYTGNLYSGIEIRKNSQKHAYLMKFVSGKTLEKTPDISKKLLFDTGRSLACLDQALVGFDDPSVHLGHQWELPQAGRHRDKIEAVEDPAERALVEWAFRMWASVADHLHELPQQVIHGDANKENLLAKGDRLTGLVDFADACFNPRVCELAILLAYLMMDREEPLAAAQSVIAGYHEVIELQEAELRVLFPLVCGRLAVTVCMASMRLTEDPRNPNWFVSLAPALKLLRHLREAGSGIAAGR